MVRVLPDPPIPRPAAEQRGDDGATCASWIDSILKESIRPDVEVLAVFFENLGRNKRLGSFQIFRRRQAARGGAPHWRQGGVEEFIDVSLRQ